MHAKVPAKWTQSTEMQIPYTDTYLSSRSSSSNWIRRRSRRRVWASFLSCCRSPAENLLYLYCCTSLPGKVCVVVCIWVIWGRNDCKRKFYNCTINQQWRRRSSTPCSCRCSAVLLFGVEWKFAVLYRSNKFQWLPKSGFLISLWRYNFA